jgi:AAA15 family ATPase/GTPase
MIKSIKLKLGRTFTSAAETFNTTPITVFVGPNNSGKSKILSEIHRFCKNGNENQNDVIISEM